MKKLKIIFLLLLNLWPLLNLKAKDTQWSEDYLRIKKICLEDNKEDYCHEYATAGANITYEAREQQRGKEQNTAFFTALRDHMAKCKSEGKSDEECRQEGIHKGNFAASQLKKIQDMEAQMPHTVLTPDEPDTDTAPIPSPVPIAKVSPSPLSKQKPILNCIPSSDQLYANCKGQWYKKITAPKEGQELHQTVDAIATLLPQIQNGQRVPGSSYFLEEETITPKDDINSINIGI